MWDLLPPGKMIPAQPMGKHNCWTAAGALVVDLSARVLNKAVRNSGWVSRGGRLFFLGLPTGRHKRASSSEASEFREIATLNHGEETNIVAQRLPAQVRPDAEVPAVLRLANQRFINH